MSGEIADLDGDQAYMEGLLPTGDRFPKKNVVPKDAIVKDVPPKKSMTVQELMNELAKLPPGMLVVTPDPGCGCCGSDDMYGIEVNQEDAMLVISHDSEVIL